MQTLWYSVYVNDKQNRKIIIKMQTTLKSTCINKEKEMSVLKNFLDEEGRITKWPAKYKMKVEVIKYISSKFELDRVYTEKEVNDVINEWHTYGDYFMLRRGLITSYEFTRKRDGSEYRKVKKDD